MTWVFSLITVPAQRSDTKCCKHVTSFAWRHHRGYIPGTGTKVPRTDPIHFKSFKALSLDHVVQAVAKCVLLEMFLQRLAESPSELPTTYGVPQVEVPAHIARADIVLALHVKEGVANPSPLAPLQATPLGLHCPQHAVLSVRDRPALRHSAQRGHCTTRQGGKGWSRAQQIEGPIVFLRKA